MHVLQRWTFYTPFHLVKSVRNCGVCMRRCLSCSSYAHICIAYLLLQACFVMTPPPSIKLFSVASYRLFHSHIQVIISYWLDEVDSEQESTYACIAKTGYLHKRVLQRWAIYIVTRVLPSSISVQTVWGSLVPISIVLHIQMVVHFLTDEYLFIWYSLYKLVGSWT